MKQEWVSQLLFEYDLFPLSIKSIDQRNSWYIKTEQGEFFLKKVEVEREKLIDTVEKFSLLQKMDFSGMIPYKKTKYGEDFLIEERGTFVLFPWVEKLCEIHELKKWEIKVLKQLANLHKLSEMKPGKGVPEGILLGVKNKWENRVEEFKSFRLKKHTRLNSFIEEGRKRSLRLAYLAINRLDDINQSTHLGGNIRTVICHGRINRKNILVGKNRKIYFVNFEKASIDSHVKDLALFFRRYAPYIHWNPVVGHEWLKGYNQVFPLTHGEKLLLGCYLLFPERVIGEVLQYGKSTQFQKKGFNQWQKRVEELRVIERFVKTITSI